MINFNLDAYEQDPVAFHSVLFSVFKGQSEILEKAIVKEFYSLMGEHYQTTSDVFDFASQMNLAKKLFRVKMEQ